MKQKRMQDVLLRMIANNINFPPKG